MAIRFVATYYNVDSGKVIDSENFMLSENKRLAAIKALGDLHAKQIA